MTPAPTVVGIYLWYLSGPKYKKEVAFAEFKRILRRVSQDYILLSVDNSCTEIEGEPFARRLNEREYELSGDNSWQEFSGWQRAIDFIRAENIACDLILFGNDRLLHRSGSLRKKFGEAATRIASKYPAFIGSSIVLPLTGQVLGHPVIPYVRTHLFLANRKVIDELQSVISLTEDHVGKLFVDSFVAGHDIFRADAPLSLPLRNYLFEHVTKRWYRRQAYSAETFSRLRNKLTAILNAFLLSSRVQNLGYALISLEDTEESFLGKNLNETWPEHRSHLNIKLSETDSFWSKSRSEYIAMPTKRTSNVWNRLSLFKKSSQLDHL